MASGESFTFRDLEGAVRGDTCAFRCKTILQPAGGQGDKVFPPTYAGAVYAKEKRRVAGREETVDCVLLDSVQSQANRMEEALQAAVDDGRISIPVVVVDFSNADLLTAIGRVTSLQAPHRIADAILRDSLLDGQPFRKTAEGQCLDTASLANATPLYSLCPTALVFGLWDSTGPKGGMGAKFQRTIVGEIVGIDAVYGVKTSSRSDPLQIVKTAGPLYRRADGGYTLDPTEAIDEKGKDNEPTGKKLLYKPNKKGQDVYHDPSEKKYPDQGRPSEANHGNVTPDIDYRKDKKRLILDEKGNPIPVGGVTISSAEQVVTLSLPALRRLRFPVNGAVSTDVDVAGRTVLAALALCAAALAAEKGFDLRSRCLLWPTEPMGWELLGRPGETPDRLKLEADTAIGILREAVSAAESKGLSWRKEPLVLKPAPQLMQLVQRSQTLAAAGKDEGEEEEGE